MSAPSSLNVLINPQALSQAASSQQCGNVIYMIRGAKSENGSQIVIQNTQELLNLLNKNHSKFAIAQSHNDSVVERAEITAISNESKVETKCSDNFNNHLNLQQLSKDSRIVIKTLDKSHSFLVVRNGNRNAQLSIEPRTEKKESKTSQANEHDANLESLPLVSKETSEKLVPIGSGEFKVFRFPTESCRQTNMEGFWIICKSSKWPTSCGESSQVSCYRVVSALISENNSLVVIHAFKFKNDFTFVPFCGRSEANKHFQDELLPQSSLVAFFLSLELFFCVFSIKEFF